MKSYFKVFIIGLKSIRDWMEVEKPIIVGLAAIFAVNLFGWSYILIKNNDLEQRSAYALGKIDELGWSRRGKQVIYEFYVNDKTYFGVINVSSSTKIIEGDSVIVKYEYTNPDNNEVYCYFESTLDWSKLPDSVYYRVPINDNRMPRNCRADFFP